MYQLIMGAKVETYPKDSVIVQVKFMHGDADHTTTHDYIFGILKEDWVLTQVTGFNDADNIKEIEPITLNEFLNALDEYCEQAWDNQRDFVMTNSVLSRLWFGDDWGGIFWPEDITISEWDQRPAAYESRKVFYNDFDGILFHVTTERIETDV